MSTMIKLVFFSILAALIVSFYGDDIVRVLSNEANLVENAAPRELTRNKSIANNVVIPQRRDGHYWTDATINHAKLSLIVDTGASVVTLSYRDAKKLGIPYFDSDFSIPVNTAGGQTKMAPVRLERVTIGSIELYDVDALIAQDGLLSVSLLGMNFLNRLDRFEFDDQRLILEQ